MRGVKTAEAHPARETRTGLLTAGFFAVFVVGIVLGRLTAGAKLPTKQGPAALANAAPVVVDSPRVDSGPTEFYGVAWGSSEKSARRSVWDKSDATSRRLYFGWDCYSEAYGRTCSHNYAMSNKVSATAHYHFVKDTFQAVNIEWAQYNWSFVRAAFKKRFGAPTQTGVQTLQNAMGATFTSEWDEWRWAGKTLTIWEYGSKIDEGAGVMKAEAFDKAVAGARENALKDAAAKF